MRKTGRRCGLRRTAESPGLAGLHRIVSFHTEAAVASACAFEGLGKLGAATQVECESTRELFEGSLKHDWPTGICSG